MKGQPPKGMYYANAERRDCAELTLREEYILIQRGHLPPRRWTLREIAILLGCTYQNVSLIEQSAIARLRNTINLEEWVA